MGKYDQRFKNTAGAKLSNRNPYLEPNVKVSTTLDPATGKPVETKEFYEAKYDLEVIRCTSFESREGVNFFCAEVLVVDSDNPSHPKGSVRSWMQDMDQDAGPGAMKGFLVAALGKDHKDAEDAKWIEANESEIPSTLVEALEDPTEPDCKNALKGFRLKVSVNQTITKKKGQPFNLHAFRPDKAWHKAREQAA